MRPKSHGIFKNSNFANVRFYRALGTLVYDWFTFGLFFQRRKTAKPIKSGVLRTISARCFSLSGVHGSGDTRCIVEFT